MCTVGAMIDIIDNWSFYISSMPLSWQEDHTHFRCMFFLVFLLFIFTNFLQQAFMSKRLARLERARKQSSEAASASVSKWAIWSGVFYIIDDDPESLAVPVVLMAESAKDPAAASSELIFNILDTSVPLSWSIDSHSLLSRFVLFSFMLVFFLFNIVFFVFSYLLQLLLFWKNSDRLHREYLLCHIVWNGMFTACVSCFFFSFNIIVFS